LLSLLGALVIQPFLNLNYNLGIFGVGAGWQTTAGVHHQNTGKARKSNDSGLFVLTQTLFYSPNTGKKVSDSVS
jgi:hypothetical protein